MAIHLVRLPTPNEADAIGVYANAKHGHCTATASGASRLISSVTPDFGVEGHPDANAGGEDGRRDVGPCQRSSRTVGKKAFIGVLGRPCARRARDEARHRT